MARLSADARYCLASEATPAEAVARLNRGFCSAGWEDRFVTLVLAVLDIERHVVTLVNAGHVPPLLVSGGKVVEAVDERTTRLPLGVDDDVAYAQMCLTMAPGDCLALYTDGITEAMNENDELYGQERLLAQLAGEARGVVGRGRRILGDVKRFVGSRSQSDDMCLVCFGRMPAD
jgi:serine phosphatase RsbU (regulator of sigma subunit)